MKTILMLTALLGLAILSGCDSKAQQNNKTAQNLADDIQELNADANAKRKEQLADGEGLAPDSSQLNEMRDMLEDAADGSSGAQAALFKQQAKVLEDLQSLMQPFERDFGVFMGLGGIDPTTIEDVDDIDRRLVLIDQLAVQGEKLDREVPALLRQLEGDKNAIEQQIVLIGQIRQTDRLLYRDMRGVFGILRDRWDGIQFDTAGNMLFGADTPDAVLNEYNTMIDQIQTTGAEQARLQKELVELTSP